MRLLYVGMRWDYGDFARGESFEHWNFYHSLRTYCLKRGWTFQYYDFMERGRVIGQDAMSEELYALCRDFRPELLFSVLFDATHDPHLPVFQAISELGTLTLNWFCDDHWRYDGYSRLVAPHFDRVCTTASSALPKYQADGLAHKVIKSQWACNHELYRPSGHPPDMDVSFVGMNHGNRADLLEYLSQEGLNIEIFGHGWVGRPRVDFADMVALFGRSKINLNLSNSSVMTGQQIKGRNFEVPGCGAFLLTGTAENLEDYFINGKETVLYHDEGELPELIRHYLTHEAERTRIAAAGYERVIAEHTWHHRFDEIFQQVDGKFGRGGPPDAAARGCSVILAESSTTPRDAYLSAAGFAHDLHGTDLTVSILIHGEGQAQFLDGIVHRWANAAQLSNLNLCAPVPDVFCAVSSWDLFRTVVLPETTLKAAIVTDELPDAPILSALDLVFCVSRALEAKLLAQAVPPAKIRMLPLGAGTLHLASGLGISRSDDAVALASLPRGADGQDPRVRAIRLATQHHPDLHMRKPAESPVPLPILLSQCSAVLFPETGGWPGLTPIVAQSYGCIPIVPASHPLSETVVDGETGIVLARYSAAEMALALLTLHGDAKVRLQMRTAAMEHVRGLEAREAARTFRAAVMESMKP